MKEKAENYCGNERPLRKTLCQLKKGHKGSHRAVIFWETENENKEVTKCILCGKTKKPEELTDYFGRKTCADCINGEEETRSAD